MPAEVAEGNRRRSSRCSTIAFGRDSRTDGTRFHLVTTTTSPVVARSADEEERATFEHVSRRNAFLLTRVTRAYPYLLSGRCWHCHRSRCELGLLVSHGERQMNNKQSWRTSVPVFIVLAPTICLPSFIRTCARAQPAIGRRVSLFLASVEQGRPVRKNDDFLRRGHERERRNANRWAPCLVVLFYFSPPPPPLLVADHMQQPK